MIFKNATVIDPLSGLNEKMDIRIIDGKIVELKKEIEVSDSENDVYDLTGQYIAPSLFDTHVHFRDFDESDKETYLTGSLAALRGGFTHVCAMANTKPPIDSIKRLKEAEEKIKKCPITIYQSVNVTKDLLGKELTNLKEFEEYGVKCITDDGFPLKDINIMIEALKFSLKTGIILSLHEEDPSYIKHSGYDDTAPRIAEIEMIRRDLELLKKNPGHMNIQHLSSKESVQLIREAKEDGVAVTCEVTPSHLTFTKDMVDQYGTLLKINPPIREEEDRMALIQGLKDGTIDFIATDHAPHTIEDKNLGKFESKSGILALETSFPLALKNLYHTGFLSLSEIIEKMSTNPRRLFGIEQKIAVGEVADLIIFDVNKEFNFQYSQSKSKNTPLLGKTFKGSIIMTIKNGKILFSDVKGANL